ncbi:MAG TPA: ABC transporter permease [Anaerolineales bacterium]|nr:ABC transporter permease [Anaerolineales bacterium]
MSLLNTLLTSLQGVSANKLRAFLTTLGVVMGVASVIAMLALGNGARAAVEEAFRFLGSDEIQINPKFAIDDGEMTAAGKKLSYEDGLLLTDSVPLVNRVDMAVTLFGKIRFKRANVEVTVTGATSDALQTLAGAGEVQPLGWPEGEPLRQDAFMEYGRFFTHAEVLSGDAVCVLGYDTALDLFSGDDPLGETVWVNRKPCLVIGVLAELESTDPANRYSTNPNETFFIPISTAMDTLFENEPSVNLTAHVSDETQMDAAKAQIAAYLRERHMVEQDAEGNYLDDFDIVTRKDILGSQQEAARAFSWLLAAMATVSLVVGGIGIMNVMLVSVTERTREIGVRLAVGAHPGNIIAQFLLESVLISLGGGLLGIAIGVLAIPLASSLNQGRALLDPESIPLALGVAVLTGVVFGLYPALRAARLNPIDALRYE